MAGTINANIQIKTSVQLAMETIKIKCPLGYMEYTKEELGEEIADLAFLRDAFLVLLNERVAAKSDIPYSKKEVLEYTKEMYLESGYSKEFIEKCFE